MEFRGTIPVAELMRLAKEREENNKRASAFLDRLENDLFKYGEASVEDAEWAIEYLRGRV